MPVYYRGPLATITHDVIVVPQRQTRKFAIADLRAVHAVRRESGRSARRCRLIAVSAPAVALAAMITLPLPLAVLVALVSSVSAGACLRVRPRHRYELVALVAGTRVVLADTPDRVEFDQVRRGLTRALEQHRDRVNRL